MGFTDKLPLLNSKSKIVKIIGYVLYAFVILMIIGAMAPSEDEAGDKSIVSVSTVVMDGWNFTLKNTGEWTGTDPTVERADGPRWRSNEVKGLMDVMWQSWRGQVVSNAFYIPDDRNGTSNSKGIATVFLLNDDKSTYPEGYTAEKSLSDAAYLANGNLFEDYLVKGRATEENTTFNGMPAVLVEEEDGDTAAISIRLSPEKIALINVINYANGDAKDIIEKISVTPSTK